MMFGILEKSATFLGNVFFTEISEKPFESPVKAAVKWAVEHVKTLCYENKLAVLWATHLIDEVDEKGKLIVLDKGKILANDNVKNILKKTKAKNISNAFDYYT